MSQTIISPSTDKLQDGLPDYKEIFGGAQSRDEALEIAIRAAESSMAALKLAKDPKDKAKHSGRLKALLAEAEKIKKSHTWPPYNVNSNVLIPQKLSEPSSTRSLPASEQIILLKASYLNGCKFPPWTGAPPAEEFDLKDGEPLFLDPCELALSEMQDEVLGGWKRPSEALPPPSWYPISQDRTGPTLTPSYDIDLVQDAATDCSVVASLCAGVARAKHGHMKILPGTLFPSDEETNSITMSKNGKYIVKLNFNGCYRRVVIDDRLPVSNTKRVIHVVDMQNPGLLWPALVEKAYLKVRGGYDFPGSNSGTDIWILTGWIPEQVFLHSDDLEPDRLWQRMSRAHAHGDVLITLGTGKMSGRTEEQLGLASEHDYAVLDLREVDGQRLLLVKNPWIAGISWNGRFDRANHTSTRHCTTPGDNDSYRSSRDRLNADDTLLPGRFWMDLDNVIQNFESIYLNWNSGLFKYRQDVHFTWDLSSTMTDASQPRGSFASLTRNPQYAVTASTGGTIWVVLCRHFRNAISEAATDEEIASGKYNIDLNGHMSVAAFASNGRRVLLSERHLQKGWFVDSPQTLLKLENCVPETPYTIVPLEQNLDAAEQNFTMVTYSNSPITIKQANPRYPHTTIVTSGWTKETAGGNAHHAAYSTNPQFSINIPQTTSISILLETPSDRLNVHVKLVSGKGKRVYAVRSKDIVFDSKDYRRTCCVAEHVALEAGRYTIICSTFEPQQLGTFTLRVESDVEVKIDTVPREGAGRIRLQMQNVTFCRAQTRVAARIDPHRLVNIYAVARPLAIDQTTNRANRSLVRISIEEGRGDQSHVYSESNDGEHADITGGVRTGEVDLKPSSQRVHGLRLVLDRVPVGGDVQDETLRVELYADQIDALAYGSWQDWGD